MVSAAWSVSFTKAGKEHDCVTRLLLEIAQAPATSVVG
jgi:hypothetical protein